MALKSDAQGFLLGTPLEMGSLVDELRALRREAQAIRRAMEHDAAAPAPNVRHQPAKMPEAATPAVARAGRAGDPPSDALRALAPIAEPARRGAPAAESAAPAHEAERDDGPDRYSGGPGVTGRTAAAATEVAKAVVNEESDASVKAFNEIAQPLKRGWSALRGDAAERRERRSEGWLKRIFGALTGDGSEDVAHAGGESRFMAASDHAAADGGRVHSTTRGTHMAYVSRGGSGADSRAELSLRSIEGYLRSIDRKMQKPERDNLMLRLLVGIVTSIKPLYEFLLNRRMDRNLDKIQGYTREQLEVSRPFFAFVRKRLKEMGEVEEGGDKKRGWFGTLIAATLGVLFAKLAALLAGVPLLGKAIAALARMLGGNVPIVPRGARGAPGATALPGPAAAKPKWGKTAGGVRGNRVARMARVVGRNAGKALRPIGAMATRLPVLGALLTLGAGIFGSRAIAKDDTLNREQKNAAQGRNWGRVGGSLGGAISGAALGTAIAGPIGTIVGGVLGSVLGQWLGGNLGEKIGEKFSVLMAPVLAGFNEVKLWALACFDWVRDGAVTFYEGAGTVFAAVGDWISTKWGELVDAVSQRFDTFAGLLTTILGALKNVPVLGDAIRAFEFAARKAAEVAGGAADAAKSVAEGAANAAGRAWDGTKAWLKDRIPDGIEDRVAYGRALETAADYRAGNIKGLDDAHTRELVASTALTESGGGKLDAVNAAGYVGRYQAGASWLAEAGHIKGGPEAVKAAMKADGHSSEWSWGKSGGMSRFLRNDANWAGGMTLGKYMASAEVQDAAFKTNSDRAYDQLVKGGQITAASTPEQIAGLLKARHLAGLGGARAVAAGGTGASDANGTSARKYYDDLAGSNARFAGMFDRPGAADFSAVIAASNTVAAPTAPAPVAVRGQAPMPPPIPVAASIPDAPQVQVPLGSGGSQTPIAVRMQQPDVGQDVRDRGIAHIATGGYARM